MINKIEKLPRDRAVFTLIKTDFVCHDNTLEKLMYIGFFIAFILILGCGVRNEKFLLDKISVGDLCNSREIAIENDLFSIRTAEVSCLKKKCSKILKALAKELKKHDITFPENCVINLIDNIYDPGAGKFLHGGIIWSKSFYVSYRYDFSERSITSFETGSSFDNYPKQADINIDWVIFLDSLQNFNKFERLPSTGRTGGGYCVYSRFDSDSIGREVMSFAFRQY